MTVGDYVRTKKDGIGKIIKIEPFMNHTHIFLDSEKGNITFQTKNRVCKVCNEESIIKSSPNIIDLIEVGDYVNGERVFGFGKFKYDDGAEEITSLTLDKTISCLLEDIKSIVTREQFESMEYKVGD